MARSLFYYLLVFTTLITFNANAQNILQISDGGDFFIKSGSQVVISGLDLNPSSNFLLTGPTTIIKADTPAHAGTQPFTRLAFQFSPTTLPFSGTLTFRGVGANPRGIPIADLKLYIHDGTTWRAFNQPSRNSTYPPTFSGITNVPMSELALGGAMPVLPVRFVSQSLICQSGSVIARWTTASETGIRRFSIESSQDGIVWKEVGTTEAINAGVSNSSYNFIDPDPSGANIYYRIAGYDLNGKKTLSSILRSTCGESEKFVVYPNPAGKDLFATVTVRESSHATFRIHDQKGLLLLTKEIELPKGSTRVEIDVARLATGNYTITGVWNDEVKVIRFLKE